MKKLQMTVELQRTAILHAEDVEVEALHYWAPEVDGDEGKTMGVHRISFYLRRLLFFARAERKFFLTAPGKLLTVPPTLVFYRGGKEFTWAIRKND